MKIPKRLRKELRKLIVYISGLFLFLLVVFIFQINVIGIVTALFLIVVGSFSKIYKQFTGKLSVGFELITPITILFAYRYGILFASASALLMLLFSSFIAGKIDFPAMVCEAGIYLVICILTVMFNVVAFVPLAIVMVIMRNALLTPLGVVLLGRNFIHLVIVIATDLFFNVGVVIWFGEFFLNLL